LQLPIFDCDSSAPELNQKSAIENRQCQGPIRYREMILTVFSIELPDTLHFQVFDASLKGFLHEI